MPDAIDRLVVIDNVPTRIIARDFDAQKAKAYWFFLFHLVPDLPEALIAGREAIWLRHFFSDWCYDPAAISGEAFDTYVRAYQAPGAVRGAMADYRANAEDVAQDIAAGGGHPPSGGLSREVERLTRWSPLVAGVWWSRDTLARLR